MKSFLADLIEQFRAVAFMIPASIGGLVDYLNQLQRGSKAWSIMSLFSHMLSAVFFGWMSGIVAFEFFQSVGMVAACGGAGGFLGARLPNIILYGVLRINRRK
tara:strand:- start:2597 stop:2905 length:309 start_codon:yes stop_codon:yes gene_type:complete